ncbi:vWA domain-containing protein [Oceanospirillum sediminis]|uniref:VWA domain-containing protein n=1 Tax=Oceanospirillum sediminis TaxID=2760088 RepID=A0A839ILB4_9GAMM|nr:VWA domain-containing protein [Oceanospirillum sediminis]MBB1485332.1 VWA domain-containing protein [Oceanospirillum sediminis]
MSAFSTLYSHIDFIWPWIFLLLPLPWLVYRFFPTATPRQYQLKISWLSMLTQDQKPRVHRSSATRLIFASLLWLLLLIAASHPQWTGDPVPLPNKGHDLLMAVDISGSMQVQDMEVEQQMTDRLSAVKNIVSDFVLRREGDRLGLIVFGTRAYLHVPLSHDRNTVSEQLKGIQLRMAGEQTAIGDAIGLAVKRLKDQPEDARVLVLLTDGANTAGSVEPLQAATLAKEQKVRIYTIGIGADEMEVQTLFGLTRRVNPSQELDEYTLQKIARETGGVYFRARSTEELSMIYQELDRLEPIEQNSQVFRPRHSLLHWPLLTVIILISLTFAHRWLLSISQMLRTMKSSSSDTLK